MRCTTAVFLVGSILILMGCAADKQPASDQVANPNKCEMILANGGSQEELARSGCCSHHSGVCGCSGGRAACCDGTLSPSCGCD